MKTQNSIIKRFAVVTLFVFMLENSCLAQGGTMVSNSNIGTPYKEFHPAILGLKSNDVVFARQFPGGEIVFFSKASGHAISRATTNGVCYFNGRFFFATRSRGPSQVADIYMSQSFETNELSAAHTILVKTQLEADYHRAESPNRKHINLKPILQAEYETSLSSRGTPLQHAELVVEHEKLVLLFESFTHMKGKVVLDDQLNPISMAIIPDKKSAR